MRSLGSRAIRIEIERCSDLGGEGDLTPCMSNTPWYDTGRRPDQREPVPGPLVAPEVRLKTRNSPEAQCDQQIAARDRRGLGEIICADKARPSQIVADIAQFGH